MSYLFAARALLKRVPRWVWIALAIGIALLLALRWHAGQVAELKRDAFAAGYAKAIDDGKQAVARIERTSAAIAGTLRKRNHEENLSIARDADALRVRGPAAAACRDPAVPAGPGRRVAPGGPTDAAAAGVPDADRAIVPFDWLVDSAEIGDANRAEVIAWREWHRQLTEEWAKAAIK